MSQDLKPLILEVLHKGYLMSLGTVDAGGVWVSDVIYVFDDDLNIYWMSDPDVRHSQAIMKNNSVAVAIAASGQGEDNFGLQLAGVVSKIDGPRYDLAVKHFTKRQKPLPSETDDVLEGDSWYMLKPTFIELIHEPLFGFKKQKLEL